MSQVVHGYGDVCQSITDLALHLEAPISVEEFRILNRCLDDAIASAVTEYGRGNQSIPTPKPLATTNAWGSSRMNPKSRRHRFPCVRGGQDRECRSWREHRECAGRSLSRFASDHHSVAEVRFRHDLRDCGQFGIGELIAERSTGAALEACSRGLSLTWRGRPACALSMRTDRS